MVASALGQKRPADRYVVGVADRMIENWILADWESLRMSIPNLPAEPPSVEGRNGKGILRRLLRDQGYSATIDGPKLLRKARPSFIQRQSKSFDEFRRQLAISCWWLAH